MDGWNTFSFPFGMAYFQGLLLLVSGRVIFFKWIGSTTNQLSKVDSKIIKQLYLSITQMELHSGNLT